MNTKNRKQKPTFQDIWVVSQAAAYLTNQACTISARHINDGVVRLQFNREVAYYARSIVREVEDGRKTVDQGLKEIKHEQESLLNQSLEVGRKGIGVIAGALQFATGAGICYASVGTLCLLAGIPIMAHGANNRKKMVGICLRGIPIQLDRSELDIAAQHSPRVWRKWR